MRSRQIVDHRRNSRSHTNQTSFWLGLCAQSAAHIEEKTNAFSHRATNFNFNSKRLLNCNRYTLHTLSPRSDLAALQKCNKCHLFTLHSQPDPPLSIDPLSEQLLLWISMWLNWKFITIIIHMRYFFSATEWLNTFYALSLPTAVRSLAGVVYSSLFVNELAAVTVTTSIHVYVCRVLWLCEYLVRRFMSFTLTDH